MTSVMSVPVRYFESAVLGSSARLCPVNVAALAGFVCVKEDCDGVVDAV